jgi:membrane-associated protease RseP (regulator of RpoE activity)
MPQWVLIALAVLALFWVSLILANRRYHLEKRGFTISSGMLMWRTERGLKFIDRIAKISPRGWRAFGTAAAVIGFALMATFFILLALNTVVILQRPDVAVPGARFVIPGVTIPLVYGLIAIFSVLVVHEFSHGFVMRAQGLRTKSIGVLLFLVIPGAFVEPDEKQLKKASMSKRLRVYGAGSFANVLFALLCLGIVLLALSPKAGVYVYSTEENYEIDNTVVSGPSWGILQPGDRLVKINDVPINVHKDFREFMENTKENDNLKILTTRGTFYITVGRHYENENRGYMGVWAISAISRARFFNPFFATFAMYQDLFTGFPILHPYTYDAHLPWELITLLKWMFLLNLGIGIINLLPAKPLDGGYIAADVMERASSKHVAKHVSYALSLVVLALLIVNFMPMFT